MQTAMVWSCFPFIRSGQNHLARHSERGKKTRQTEEEVGRQHQEMDRPGVRQVPEGSGEQEKMEKTGCKIICGAPTTFAVEGLMMMMMMMFPASIVLHRLSSEWSIPEHFMTQSDRCPWAHLHVVGMLRFVSDMNQPAIWFNTRFSRGTVPVKQTELAHSFLFCSCVYFCLYGPFNCISLHKVSRQLSVFSLCSSGLVSALMVLSLLRKSSSALM